MATVYILETNATGGTGNFPISAAFFNTKAIQQTVAIGGSSAQSSAFNVTTNLIRVHVDAICSINIGSNPTATTTTARLAANQTEYFTVNPGDKLAVITNT